MELGEHAGVAALGLEDELQLEVVAAGLVGLDGLAQLNGRAVGQGFLEHVDGFLALHLGVAQGNLDHVLAGDVVDGVGAGHVGGEEGDVGGAGLGVFLEQGDRHGLEVQGGEGAGVAALGLEHELQLEHVAAGLARGHGLAQFNGRAVGQRLRQHVDGFLALGLGVAHGDLHHSLAGLVVDGVSAGLLAFRISADAAQRQQECGQQRQITGVLHGHSS